MNLEILKDKEIVIDDNIKNATSTIEQTFNNAFDKTVQNADDGSDWFSKIKNGIEKVNVKKVASDAIDTVVKGTLKTVTGMKAKTIDSLQDLGKSIRNSDIKGVLKNTINIGVDNIKTLPIAVKKAINGLVDLTLGDTFDNELDKVMTKQKKTLNRIDKKCDNFDKALLENNEKDMKKYANSISKDLEKISLISETIDRGKNIVNQYELMKNKGSIALSTIEQELCKQLV